MKRLKAGLTIRTLRKWLNSKRVGEVFCSGDAVEALGPTFSSTTINNNLRRLISTGELSRIAHDSYTKAELVTTTDSPLIKKDVTVSTAELGEAIVMHIQKQKTEIAELWEELQRVTEQRDKLQEALNGMKMKQGSDVSINELLKS